MYGEVGQDGVGRRGEEEQRQLQRKQRLQKEDKIFSKYKNWVLTLKKMTGLIFKVIFLFLRQIATTADLA